MPKPSTPLPYGANCDYEVSEEVDDDRYGVIRFYRYRRSTGDSTVIDTYRVTIERNLRSDRSSAHADVQNPNEKWSRIVSKDASKWHSTTSPTAVEAPIRTQIPVSSHSNASRTPWLRTR